MATTRARSFWAWGWEDRYPDDDSRAGLAMLVEHQLGLSGLTPLPMPRLEDARIPPGRRPPPEGLPFITADAYARITHTYGRAYPDLLRGFRGDFMAAPDLVASPADEAEVVATLDWAAAEGVAVVPYGGGTSVVGGWRPGAGATGRSSPWICAASTGCWRWMPAPGRPASRLG